MTPTMTFSHLELLRCRGENIPAGNNINLNDKSEIISGTCVIFHNEDTPPSKFGSQNDLAVKTI